MKIFLLSQNVNIFFLSKNVNKIKFSNFRKKFCFAQIFVEKNKTFHKNFWGTEYFVPWGTEYFVPISGTK